jgi:hypothetical protein
MASREVGYASANPLIEELIKLGRRRRRPVFNDARLELDLATVGEREWGYETDSIVVDDAADGFHDKAPGPALA